MSYSKQNFKDGNVLTASELNKMDDAIYALDSSSSGNFQILTLPEMTAAEVTADFFDPSNRFVDGKGFITTRFINDQTCIANVEFVKKINKDVMDWNVALSASATDGSFTILDGNNAGLDSALSDMIIQSFGYTNYQIMSTNASVSFLGSFNVNNGYINLITRQLDDNPQPEFASYILCAAQSAITKMFQASGDVLAILNIEHTIFTSREY